MKYFLLIFIFLFLFLNANEKKGYFIQSLEFEYQFMELNKYYRNGEILNMYDNSSLAKQNNLGLNYLLRSKTGYNFWIFTTYLEYTFSINENNQYNIFNNKVNASSSSYHLHELTPTFIFHYDPFGLNLGFSYLKKINKEKVNQQIWSLRPDNSMSVFFRFYWPQFFEIPIGISLNYEIALKLHEKVEEDLYQKASFGFHINFSYYSQFELLYTFVHSSKRQNITRMNGNNNISFLRDKNHRYYLDYILIFQITEYLALKLGMGQLLYSEYESPMLRFNIGIATLIPTH